MNSPILSTSSLSLNLATTSPTTATTITATATSCKVSSSSNDNNPLKRKRIMKSVHFAQKVTVLETYSSEEYDRSEIFSAKPIIYKINPKIVRSTPQLSLNIPSLLTTTTTTTYNEGATVMKEGGEQDISSAEISPNTPPSNTLAVNVDEYFNLLPQKEKNKKQRPILSVNTAMCADPLFFTSLTTNYKHDINSASSSSANDDFLVPISATIL